MFGKQRGRKVAENAMGKESWEMISLRLKMIIALALISALMFGFGKMCLAEGKSTEVPRMTKEELQAMLGSPDVVILDVRVEDEWKGSESKIKGAIREDLEKDIKSWAGKYPKDKALVLYCSWPHEETSAWTAQQLIPLGFKKVYVLKGGWEEWFKAKYPVETK